MHTYVNQEAPFCRICYEETGPIICLPCQCKGSLGYIHESCLNQYFRSKQGSLNISGRALLSDFKCDICKGSLELEVTYEFKWGEIPDIQIQMFLILFVICCLGIVGLQFAESLINQAMQQNTHYVQNFVYLFTIMGLMGVVLYLLIQPIISQLKQSRLKIRPKLQTLLSLHNQ